MRILVLGGGDFVGRAVVDSALDGGHEVTTLNRGTSAPPPGVTALVGDRRTLGGLDALGEQRFDAVIDTWSWAPTAVRDATLVLRERVGRYLYVSTESVYADPIPAGSDETAAVVDGDPDGGDGDYPAMKRGAEVAVERAFGDRGVLARPGLVLGPRENIGRLPWWLGRIARGGRVLAPGPADLGIQWIDARDLADWLVHAAGSGAAGAYNLVAPVGTATMGDLLAAAVAATGSDAELVWVDPERILAAGVAPWMDLPIWLPPGEDHDAMHDSDVRRALDAGLRIRPIDETVRDTWDWLRSIGGAAPQRTDRPALGLDPELEARLLA